MPVRSEARLSGQHLRLVLDQPKGNILSADMISGLRHALVPGSASNALKLVTIEGAGDSFSYGASVEEHTPPLIGKTLAQLHDLIRDLLDVTAPTAAIVRGRCLGGGFEVALACDLIFASDTAMLGVPEIALGVFPPAATALLPLRIGASRAARAVLTGEARPAAKWHEAGLVELVAPADRLGEAVDEWFNTHLAPRSAAALRYAAAASRVATRRYLDGILPELEQLYLERLMRTHDAIEGINAFLEKRTPCWSNA